MKNKPFPERLRRRYWNWRRFKATKRREIRLLLRDSEDMQRASAFIPREAYALTNRIRQDLHSLQDLLSEKEWGR